MSQDSTQTSLQLLYEISRQLVSSLDLKTVLASVLTIAVDNVGAERGMLIVLDEKQQPSDAAIVYRGRLLPFTHTELKAIFHQGLAGWVQRTLQAVLIADTSRDERWLHRPDDDVERSGPKSAICAPVLWAGNQLVGVLTIVHPQPGFFSNDHLQLVQAIADQAAVAIYNARLYQSLELAHRRYHELFEASIDPIVISDWQGRLVEANRTALQTFGIAVNGTDGQDIRDLHTPDWELLGDDFSSLLDAAQAVSYQSQMKGEGGRLIPCDVYVHRVHIEAEDHLQWVFRDISARVELQKLQDELFAMVYHDLRSPLSNVVSSLDLIKSMLPLDTHELLEPVVNIAIRSTERVRRLANSLLDIQRLEAGQPIVERKDVHIPLLIADALEIMRPNAEAKQINLENRTMRDIPPLHVDEDMIRRVFVNLLENAVKFTPVKGEVAVDCAVEDRFLRLWVQDTGEGIPVEAREQIFHKFTRLKEGEARRGIGLGLAFCRLAVEAHGGKIWAEENQPQGSRLVFVLPLPSEEG